MFISILFLGWKGPTKLLGYILKVGMVLHPRPYMATYPSLSALTSITPARGITMSSTMVSDNRHGNVVFPLFGMDVISGMYLGE